MNILLLGSGGREHALAWKLAQSPALSHLFIVPGNAGTALTGTNLNVSVNDFQALKKIVLDRHIEMVIVGPEDPLVNGIHDFFLADPEIHNVPVIGPRKKAAMLEGSKDFAKQFMIRHGIPTARYRTFDPSTVEQGIAFLSSLDPPYVLKADGLAAGKGVIICQNLADAVHELSDMLVDARFGKASHKVVVEEFLKGIELSVFILTDGINYKILPEAKDYKRIGEGDTGLNTGGMGSISPVPFADKTFMDKVESRIIRPTVEGLLADNIDYRGFIFFGLMNVGGDPYLIEYNCRLGDPETESVIPRLKNDLVHLLLSTARQHLDKETIAVDPQYAATVMLVSKGYPGFYEKGKIITGEKSITGSFIFHAGTKMRPDTMQALTNGGRVLAVTNLADTLQEALSGSYENIKKIEFEGKYFRRDIGFDLDQTF
ncbi:MAG: phosphoribosylamine--glycine ligase [Bacteroidales bacterium]|nr:phosphoribosylamine--glycine ligase [Bacteroidales bacterium]